MTVTFGDLIKDYCRRCALSQSRLAQAVGLAPSVLSRMCKGERLAGPYARERVLRVIVGLVYQGVLETSAEANALLQAAGKSLLTEGELPSVVAILQREATEPFNLTVGQEQQLAALHRLSPVSAPPLPDTFTARPSHNLPPHHGPFLGRSADLARVLEGLRSPWPVTVIEGFGGVGKTTLALEVARRCLPGSHVPDALRFVAAVWISAKDRPEQAQWLEEVLDTIARVLEYPVITQSPAAQKRYEVETLLRERQVLIIVDNCETIIDPELFAWLQRIPEPSKALLTTRRLLLESVWPAPLGGLDREDALRFIRQHSYRLGLPAVESAEDATLLPLFYVTQGNPKALEMALGYVKQGMVTFSALVDTLQNAGHTADAIFTDLFRRGWETLNTSAQDVLLAMTFFAGTAAKAALGATAGLDANALEDALRQLVDLSLLEVAQTEPTLRYSIHPLTRAFAAVQVQAHSAWEDVARERWLGWYETLLTEHMPQNREFWPFVRLLTGEDDNLVTLLFWVWDHYPTHIAALTLNLWVFFYVRGHWDFAIMYTQRVIEAIPQGHPLRLGLISYLAWLLVDQSRNAEAETWLQYATMEMVEKYQVETWILNNLADSYLHLKDWRQAERLCYRALNIARCQEDDYEILVVRYRLARIRFELGYGQEAAEIHLTLVAECQQRGWQRAESYCAHRLGRILLSLEQLDEAEQWINHAANLVYIADEPLLHAYLCDAYARLAELRGQPEIALTWAREAQDRYHRLGARGHEAEMTVLIACLGTGDTTLPIQSTNSSQVNYTVVVK